MTACYDRFNEGIEPTVEYKFCIRNLPNECTQHCDSLQQPPPPQQYAFILSGYRPRMCLHRIIMQQVHTVLSVCARHSLLGETLHDVLLTLLE